MARGSHPAGAATATAAPDRTGRSPAAAAPPRPAGPAASAPDQRGPGPRPPRSEGLARLRARHADGPASIDRRTQDEHRRQQLYEQAARLNPDNWSTDADVARALEDYETALASLRDAVGRRRRRKRPRAGGLGEPGGGEGPGPRTAARSLRKTTRTRNSGPAGAHPKDGCTGDAAGGGL